MLFFLAQKWMLTNPAGNEGPLIGGKKAAVTAGPARLPEVGASYLEEYANLPWVSVQSKRPAQTQVRHTRRTNSTSYSSDSQKQNGGRLAASGPAGDRKEDQRRPNSYGEYQLQELQPRDRKIREDGGFKHI